MAMRTETRRVVLAGAVVAVAVLIALGWSASVLGEGRYRNELSLFRSPPYTAGTEPGVEITSDVTVGASFVATEDRLTEVAVRFATHGRVNSGTLIFTLAMGMGGTPERSVEVPAASLAQDIFHRFAFEPIAGSGGQTYYMALTAKDAEAGNAVSAWIGTCDCDPNGELYVDGVRQTDQELAMSVAYETETHGMLWELVNRMSQYKPELVKGVGFVLIAMVATALAFFVVGLFARRIALTPMDEPVAPWWWTLASLPFVGYFATLIW